MNQDIRISVSFLDHPKTIKLQRRLGDGAVLCLIRLWCYSAKHKPLGELTGMDLEDIEIAASWNGESSAFVSNLQELGLLTLNDGTYSVHDWEEHNPYAFHAKDRKQRAKNAAAARYANRMPKASLEDATSMPEECEEDAQGIAPSPAPIPSPNPSPEPQRAVAITLPLNSGEFFPIFVDQIAEWGTLFPAVNVPQELRNMRAWLDAKPTRRKTRRGVLSFVTSWLTRNQDAPAKQPVVNGFRRPEPTTTVLRDKHCKVEGCTRVWAVDGMCREHAKEAEDFRYAQSRKQV